jgi:4'-phosphopantetheinyl transferase
MPAERLDWPDLAADEVHVWTLFLNISAKQELELLGLLADDERDRAGRFVFAAHRRRFMACRGRLRQILAAYLNDRPERLTFRYSPQGKPSLDHTCAGALDFNTSHAADLALVAVSGAGPIGVDVEHIRPLTADLLGLAQQHFTLAERGELAALAPNQQLAAFFRGWTRKEAIIKALGTGLSIQLEQLEVGLGEPSSAQLICPCRNSPATAGWRLYTLQPAPGFVGALAAPAGTARIGHHVWP